ncbi:MAG: flagellar motor protein MotB [Steroidobacteraceae bacterium]
MFSRVFKTGARSRDEAEKPFWISYADLMTALMVLFLVVMSVALLAVTKKISDDERRKSEYDADVDAFLMELDQTTRKYPDVTLDRNRGVIDFGSRATFPDRGYRLTAEQARGIRAFVPEILALAASPRGERLLKRVVVEGFTSPTGTYLFNLNLSLQRSQSVLCALFAAEADDERKLSGGELRQIRDLFLVGGYSFNSVRDTDEKSRRVELRLELYGFKEPKRARSALEDPATGTCQLPP